VPANPKTFKAIVFLCSEVAIYISGTTTTRMVNSPDSLTQAPDKALMIGKG